MRKSTKLLKKFAALFLVVLMSIESLASVVSDIDGPAFVTKQEFEELKRNFDIQIEQYNNSIDSKIDGAIADYLNGIKLGYKTYIKLDKSFNWVFPIICMNNTEWNNKDLKYYSYELPKIDGSSWLMRKGAFNSGSASYLSWNSTAALSSNSKSTDHAVAIQKSWWDMSAVYNHLIELSDTSVDRTLGTSTIKCWKVQNCGQGCHRVVSYSMGGGTDNGHLQGSSVYWGYTWIMGMGVSGANGKGNQMVASNYANWTPSTWTRTGGTGLGSSVGWGIQGVRPFVLPSGTQTLSTARNWASLYTGNGQDYAHNAGQMGGYADSTNPTLEIIWENDFKNHRNWVFTGNSEAPATSSYGWYFNFQKPNNASDPFAGYFMKYQNDQGLATIIDGETWYGFHSWCPVWYWPYTAAGTLGTLPSTSQFSKLPAKQIYYYDSDDNIHYFDEGLFCFNMPGNPLEVKFEAKWSVLDPSITSTQNIVLKISNKPFDSAHDNNDNLSFNVDDGAYATSQQLSCGTKHKIKVKCEDDVKQIYMMWTPQTSGCYLGLSELSDFLVTIE